MRESIARYPEIALYFCLFCKHRLKPTIYIRYHVTQMLHNNMILRLDTHVNINYTKLNRKVYELLEK